ncbi:DNA replication factor Cdt1 isoform X2 [Syngnathoides biaculeatus]|uniref:DNA replication factor Cdt1 isoform X2 n=1 Tax=Syngnathoides biaculeatus TaxID=300417 RepID=UPI002ADE1F46|nr:DNA replication factor Cdt1 isoform X2 [Syngnathoides biaculeatus]
MSQALVTDFFSQSKKKTPISIKSSAAASRDTTKSGSVSSSNKLIFSNSSSSQVRDEFMRVIDAATTSSKGVSTTSEKPKDDRLTPRTRKRTSLNKGLETDTSLASTEHNITKKRRQVDLCSGDEIMVRAKTTTAKKKCVFSHPKQQTHLGEIITGNNSILKRIRKEVNEYGTAASSSISTPSFSSTITMSNSPVARAKELAAKARRTKEKESEDEKIKTDTQSWECIQQPSYQQYHNLAQDILPGLCLPYQFKILAEMFRSMDTVVAMLFNRSETATFFKIKKGVQDMIHKQFEEHHIGQIQTVFPEAYTFRQEKNIPMYNNCIKKGSYQLTVEPVILGGVKEGKSILTASDLLERRHAFHHNLLLIVKHHHKLFLSSLVPQVCVPEEKLTRWHPKFNVDTLPAVHASLLPQPPSIEKLVSAQEVLYKAHSFITPKIETALVSLVQKTEVKNAQCKKQSPKNLNSKETASSCIPNALYGVSQSLLGRIRAKETQKLQAAMTRSPSQEERLLMMTRLGQLARILRNVFVSEKKTTLIIEVICNRMTASYSSDLTSGEMEKHIRLLAELNPNWLSIHPVRKDVYLKLNKNMDLSVILDKLSCSLREEEKLSASL